MKKLQLIILMLSSMAANAGLLPNAIESQFFKSSPQNNEKRRLNESYPDLSGH